MTTNNQALLPVPGKQHEWEFSIASYWVSAGFSLHLPSYQFSLTMVGLQSADGIMRAVLYFVWSDDNIPDTQESAGDDNEVLHIRYPLSAFGGIMQLLEGEGALKCFYDGPIGELPANAGIEHENWIMRD